MWCALKCCPEDADRVMEVCKKEISKEALKDVFVFTYDRMRRYEGSWHTEIWKLFPEYIFLETENPGELLKELERCKAKGKLSDSDGRRVGSGEENCLKKLCGKERHLGMSEGYIRDGVTYITKGPLVGFEKHIRKIDRHKRLASVEGIIEGGARMTAGLEIISKS